MTPIDHKQLRRTLITSTVCACALAVVSFGAMVGHEYACHILSLARQADRPSVVISRADYVHYTDHELEVRE